MAQIKTNTALGFTSQFDLLVKARPILCGMKFLQDFYSRKFSEFSGDLPRKFTPFVYITKFQLN